MTRRIAFLVIWLATACILNAQTSPISTGKPADLLLTPADLRIENSNAGGYILYIRAKPGIGSVLITESTEPEKHKVATYAMRSKVAIALNNDQKRVLDGKDVDRPELFFLVSSTPVPDKKFGSAFQIFLPYVVVFGYPEGRHGELQIVDGAFLSIRSFERKWADYGGAYKDNPYKLRITQAPPIDLASGIYNKETVISYQKFATDTGGKTRAIKKETDFPTTIQSVLDSLHEPEIDLVLCLDATGSMQPYAEWIKTKLVPILQEFLKGHKYARFAIVQYRDVFEEFVYQVTPFTTDFGMLQRNIARYRPLGGGDIPEAVDEAIYGACNDLLWKSPRRVMVLVGDAPPHPIPRGMISHAMVDKAIKDKGVQIFPVILPTGPASN